MQREYPCRTVKAQNLLRDSNISMDPSSETLLPALHPQRDLHGGSRAEGGGCLGSCTSSSPDPLHTQPTSYSEAPGHVLLRCHHLPWQREQRHDPRQAPSCLTPSCCSSHACRHVHSTVLVLVSFHQYPGTVPVPVPPGITRGRYYVMHESLAWIMP